MRKFNPSVSVILCTHKYVKYAEQQIKSIKNQEHVSIKLLVSIDSKDALIVEQWKKLLEKYFEQKSFNIIYGPCKGFSSNFINALIKSDFHTDYIAFSDHDDLWDATKLHEAITKIDNKSDYNQPILYGSRTRYTLNNGTIKGYSKIYFKPKKFENALVQCFAGGNTMVFNKSLYMILKQIGFVDVKSHDWWIYIITTAVNGIIIYDNNSYISYRQHEENLSGGNTGMLQNTIRLRDLLNGEYRNWNKKNIYNLKNNIEILAKNNRKKFLAFIKIHEGNIIERIYYYFISGIYRQSNIQNLALFFAAILKKV